MKYTEEEKKVINELNHYINMTDYWKKQEYTNSEIYYYINLLLNLIKKQQKEIEKLTTYQMDLKDKCLGIAGKLLEYNKPAVSEYILAQIGACPVWECGEPYCNYISKDSLYELITKLEKDIQNTKKKLNDNPIENGSFKYNKFQKERLRAFVQKMKEIKEILKELIGDDYNGI